MLRYLTQRIVALVGIVFVISILCFLLVHIIPGDPAAAILGTSDTPHNRAILDAQLGLNKPLLQQYLTWIGNVLRGNLGTSQAGSTVSVLRSSFKVDLELVIYSQVLAYLVAVPMSVYAARRPRGLFDQTATSASFAVYCLPAFVLVIWLLDLLTIHWHVFPGASSNPYLTGVSFWEYAGHNLLVFFLPSVILALGSIALYYRLLRAEMAQTLQEEFVTVARSKGLSDNRILWRHALRPSLTTLLASTGNNIALLFSGLFIVEVKFALPGIGQFLVQGILDDNYILVQGIALVFAVTVVVVNFGVDIIMGLVDPRIARA